MTKIFCPRCGNKLEKRITENRERDFCPLCRVIQYENPVPATAVVVFNERNELLLVLRGQEPAKGKWCLPGGFQETGETPEQCALRELREETGLSGRVEEWIGMEMSPNPFVPEVLVVGYRVKAGAGVLKANDDALEAAYFPLGQLPELAFQSHIRIIGKAGRPLLTRLRFRDLPGGAYVVTSNDHLQVAREACRGGARIVQYRDKDAPAAAQAGNRPPHPGGHPTERNIVHCQRPDRYRHAQRSRWRPPRAGGCLYCRCPLPAACGNDHRHLLLFVGRGPGSRAAGRRLPGGRGRVCHAGQGGIHRARTGRLAPHRG